MAEQTKVKTLEKVVIRFSGDSGDGMQLTGQQFSDAAALFGNGGKARAARAENTGVADQFIQLHPVRLR